MQENSVVREINEQLLKMGGSNYKDHPNFRVVFSDDQTEVRSGIFSEYYGEVFLRTVRKTKEIPKYPWILRRWILERWAGPELTYHPDIDSSRDGDYICVYIFQDANRNYLPPLKKVAEIVVHHLLAPKLEFTEALNRDREIENREEAQEVDRNFEYIRKNYEATATEKETSSVSMFVERSEIKKEDQSGKE